MDTTEFMYFEIFFFVFLIPLVLGIIIPTYKSHYKVTGSIINYDSTMRKFVYKVNLSSEDIINLLKIRNDIDELSCTFDFDKSVIKFSDYGSYGDYYFRVQECNGSSILMLEQVSLIGMSSNISYKLNPFMVRKLQAEIIPFSQYGF